MQTMQHYSALQCATGDAELSRARAAGGGWGRVWNGLDAALGCSGWRDEGGRTQEELLPGASDVQDETDLRHYICSTCGFGLPYAERAWEYCK
eukprot:scaffold3608_cov65-Phaeocystis_antarctica.AAC.2